MPLPPILTLDIAHLTQVLSPAVFWELGSDAQVVTLNDAILCIESNDLDPLGLRAAERLRERIMAGTAKNDVPNRLALNSVFWTLSAAKVREPAQVPPEKPKADPPRAPQRTHQPPKTSRPPIVRRAASFAGEGEKLLKLFPPSIHRQVRDAFAIQGRNIDEPGDWFEVVSYLFENALSNAFRSIEKNAPRSFAAYVSLAADLLHAIQTEEAVPTSDFFRLTSDFMTMVRTATLVRHAVLSLGKETPAAWIENDVRFGHLMELQKLFENK